VEALLFVVAASGMSRGSAELFREMIGAIKGG